MVSSGRVDLARRRHGRQPIDAAFDPGDAVLDKTGVGFEHGNRGVLLAQRPHLGFQVLDVLLVVGDLALGARCRLEQAPSSRAAGIRGL